MDNVFLTMEIYLIIRKYLCEKVSHIKSQIKRSHDLFKLLRLEITKVNKIFIKD